MKRFTGQIYVGDAVSMLMTFWIVGAGPKIKLGQKFKVFLTTESSDYEFPFYFLNDLYLSIFDRLLDSFRLFQ